MQSTKHSKSDFARAQLVMAAVSLDFGIADCGVYSETKGTSRASFARQMAMYLTHIVYEINLSRVARAFSRDRSTAVHACRIIEDSREDPIIDEKLIRLEAFLEGAPKPAPELENVTE